MDQYNFGREKEELVAGVLRNQGFLNVKLTDGSRGAYDVYGQYQDGRFILVQVKASRIGIAKPQATDGDKGRLIAVANENNASAYIAYVVGTEIEWKVIRK